ncbi:MAG: indole-3-glycerol phosphate synthase TrpC [Calditrichaeota bacterium]|nr:MAG: indole-3-glycerol phosphate synthase TrpC [Calditrichota bacterium]
MNRNGQEFLARIVAAKKAEVARRKQAVPLAALKDRLAQAPPVRSLRQRLQQPGFHFLCEVKKASPSRGVIQPDFDPLARALAYQQGGADGISVLTDGPFFQGSLAHLQQVRRAVDLPVLRKDFIIDPYQLYESRAAGADVVLLIARILSPGQLQELADLTARLGMEALVEVHQEEELAALPEGPHLMVGVNNRNLRTFTVSLETSLRLAPLLPAGLPAISESGIREPEQCRRLYRAGFCGALIGEWLMRSPDPAAALQRLKMGVSRAYAD